MFSPKRLVKMARKSQKVAASRQRRIISIRTDEDGESDECSTSISSRGHLFVYTVDGERFMIPLRYLTSNIFRELFKMSEDEFGLPSNGPITLTCDALLMEYIISLHQSKVHKDVERAFLTSIAESHCTASLHRDGHYQNVQPILYGF